MLTSNAAWERFLREQRWAVLTTQRRSGQPVSSVVAYACEPDSLVVSTPRTRFKTLSIRRNPHVNLCAISNQEPFNYVSVEARAVVDEGDIVAATSAVFDAIADTGWPAPPDIAQWVRDDDRVILRLTPERVFGVIR